MKIAILNWFDRFKKRSLFSQATDILFLLLVVMIIFPSGRLIIQKAIIFTGIMQPSIHIKPDQTLYASAYDWRLANLRGDTLSLSAYQDRVLFINFWATWCPPCIVEMDSIQQLYQIYRNDPRIAFLMVTNDNEEAVRRFMKKKNYTFPIYYSDSEIPAQLRSDTIPVTYLISPQGDIIIRNTGAADWNAKGIHRAIQTLFSKSPEKGKTPGPES